MLPNIAPVRHKYVCAALLPLAKCIIHEIVNVPLPPNNTTKQPSPWVWRRKRPYTRTSKAIKLHGKHAEGSVKGEVLSRSLMMNICLYKRSMIKPGGYSAMVEAGILRSKEVTMPGTN